MTDNTGPQPEIPYWHLWTDDDGVSHQTRCTLTEFELKGIGGAAPQWNDKQDRAEATVVSPCSRSAGSATGTRTRRRNGSSCCPAAGGSSPWTARASSMGPGEFSFGEDQDCSADGWPQGPPLRHDRRRAGRADDGAVARAAESPALPLQRREPAWTASRSCDPRFRPTCCRNAPLEKLGEAFAGSRARSGSRDQDCLLVSDLPNDRIMRWTRIGRRLGVPPPVRLRQWPYPRPAGPADRLLAPAAAASPAPSLTAASPCWPTATRASA